MATEAASASIIPNNSIHLVQDLSSSRPTAAMFESPFEPSSKHRHRNPGSAVSEDMHASEAPAQKVNFITSKPRVPMNKLSKAPSADAVNPPSSTSGEQTVPASKSAVGLYPKGVPLPRTDLHASSRPQDQLLTQQPAEKQSSGPDSSGPESRQSKRWAKFQAAVDSRAGARNLRHDMRKREASLDQQRARPKTSLQARKPFSPVIASALSETGSLTHAQGLRTPWSGPTWPLVKSGRITHPAKWSNKRLSRRSHSYATTRQSRRRGGVDIAAPPGRLCPKRPIRSVKALSDLRRTAGGTSSSTQLTEYENIVNLDFISELPPARKRAGSPVPTLHDPEKVQRFSEECEEMLSHADFDKDWLITSGGAKPTQTKDLQAIGRPSTNRGRPQSRGKEVAETITAANGPGPAVPGSQTMDSVPPSNALKPPVRTSSKAGAKLAFGGRAACILTLHCCQEGDLIDTGEADRSNHPVDLETCSKKPAGGLRTEHTVKALGTIGQPPERPLPDLPKMERERSRSDTSSHANRDRFDERGGRSAGVPAFAKPATHASTSKTPSRMLRAAAFSKNLVINTDSANSTAQHSPASQISMSTTESNPRASKRLSVQFKRHDIDRIRPERSLLLKKLVKEDLAKQRRINEENKTKQTTAESTEKPLPPVPDRRESNDRLNQFPSVPISRPQSRTSTGTRRGRSQSRSRNHAEPSSKASSTRRKDPVQSLATSEIKVLVDTDPITGRFRAGAISSGPGLMVSNREGGPGKSRSGLSKASRNLQDIVTDPAPSKKKSPKRRIRDSLRRQNGARLPLSPWAASDIVSDSDDEASPRASESRSRKTSALRRAWNSNDVQSVEHLHTNLKYHIETNMKLERHVRRLERELHQQREDGQRTAGVVAPVSRANGLRAVMYPTLESSGDVESVLDRELERLHAARRRDIERKKNLNTTQAATLRPISYLSSTSGTTNVSLGSKGGCASREGSMTDPLEFETLLLPDCSDKGHGRLVGCRISGTGDLSAVKKNKPLPAHKRSGSKGSISAVMQNPSPVAMFLPRTVYVQPKGVAQRRVDEDCGSGKRKGSGGDREGDKEQENKESELGFGVNHVLASTDQMHRAIDAMNA